MMVVREDDFSSVAHLIAKKQLQRRLHDQSSHAQLTEAFLCYHRVIVAICLLFSFL